MTFALFLPPCLHLLPIKAKHSFSTVLFSNAYNVHNKNKSLRHNNMITVTNSHYDYISLFVGKQRKNKQISAFTDVC